MRRLKTVALNLKRIDLKLFPHPQWALRPSHKRCSIADARITRNKKPASYSPRYAFPVGSLIRHREQQHPVISLIHDDGKIRKLVNGHAELCRPRQAERL